jgi:hypothetical protein
MRQQLPLLRIGHRIGCGVSLILVPGQSGSHAGEQRSARRGSLPQTQGAQMEALNRKRARLRGELQEAHSSWLTASDFWASPAATWPAVDVSGYPEATRARWFAYLEVKARLVAAYAELPAAA